MPALPKIDVIVGSVRSNRVGPQITNWVYSIIKKIYPEGQFPVELNLVDIESFNLPLMDEPELPARVKRTEDYTKEHSRKWSAEISSAQGFVFVTPQYNWGMPAGLKNAIDYLFNEWGGKSALIVSYGGHGGDKSSAQLAQVLEGIHVKHMSQKPQLAFPNHDFSYNATHGKDVGLVGDTETWTEQRAQIIEGFKALVESVQEQVKAAEAEAASGQSKA